MSTRRFLAILACGAAFGVAAPGAMAASPAAGPNGQPARSDEGATAVPRQAPSPTGTACTLTSAGLVCPAGTTACAITSAGFVCAPPGCTITTAGVTCPSQGILPTQARSASARIRGPRKCVVARYAVVVRGTPITSVTFSVNGRRVRTVRARTNQRRFKVVLRATKRRSVVTARVRFASDARPRVLTLHRSVRRCGRVAVSPEFTG